MNAPNPPLQFEIARHGAGHAPLRRAGSVRRTTSIDCHWPLGFDQPWALTGRAQDVLSGPADHAPQVIASADFTMTASPAREILAIATQPAHPQAADLIGVRAGGASREALARVMGDARGTPLFQLLDDYAGASLVSRWVFSQWDPGWGEQMRAQLTAHPGFKGPRAGICSGFAPGSSALDTDRPNTSAEMRKLVVRLENPADPAGWHAMPSLLGTEGEGQPQVEPRFRRARRIDLWRDGDDIWVDAGFQDSGNTPDGYRTAIHEYRVYAQIDAATSVLRSLQALPLILPFAECPIASIKASRMIGRPVSEFRQQVIDVLHGTEGCTHLNDVLRALTDVPTLMRHLPG